MLGTCISENYVQRVLNENKRVVEMDKYQRMERHVHLWIRPETSRVERVILGHKELIIYNELVPTSQGYLNKVRMELLKKPKQGGRIFHPNCKY